MRTTNYPNHPLFRIAPLLDRGFNTVLHDEYTSHLVGRIRAGRYTSDLWDCNSFCLNYGDRCAAPADAQVRAAKSRFKLTAEQLAEYRNSPEAQERRAKFLADKAQREAEEAEFWRVRREHVERQARLAAEKERAEAERAAEWGRVGAETQQYLTEQAMIMAGSWECTDCLTPAKIERAPAGRYSLSCRKCARHTTADHVVLLNVVNARQVHPKPLNPG